MVNDGNNKAKIIYKSILLALSAKLSVTGSKFLTLSTTLLALFFIFGWILFPDNVNSGPYLNSAHGNSGISGYGVNRTSISAFGYSKGNCAHCHEQHASIGGTEPAPVDGAPSKYALFRPLFADQAESFCYACHKDPLNSIQVMMPNQYVYSRMAGGDTGINCPDDIKEAFQFENNSGNPQVNCSNLNNGSSHLLYDIETFLTNRWGYDGVIKKINPCSGCHNPHRAQKDPHTSTGRIDLMTGKLVSSVSRPSQHSELTTWELWGDDDTERMNKYNYQPPYRYNSTITYEPDGYNASDASRTVDYVTFCLDCHQYTIIGTGRTFLPIDWGPNGDIHGAASQRCVCDYADKKAPYSEGVNYVLSCLDCHEPHGSPNRYLLRQEVNGIHNPIFGSFLYYDFCRSCHGNLTKHSSGVPPIDSTVECSGCHGHRLTFPTTDLDKCSGCGTADIKTF